MVMSRYGGDTPWWRLVNARGEMAGHKRHEALQRWRQEGTPPTGGHPPRVDLYAAGGEPGESPPWATPHPGEGERVCAAQMAKAGSARSPAVPLGRRRLLPGTPPTTEPAGTSLTTTAFAPTWASSPRVTGPRTFAPAPITTRSPTVGWRLPLLIERPPRVEP